MDRSKIVLILEELLDKYYWAKGYAIQETTTSLGNEEWDDLDREVENYKKRIEEALS